MLTRFRFLMGAFALTFLLAGLAFALLPGTVLAGANLAGTWLGLAPVPADPHRFWVALAVSMMAAISVNSWLLYRDPVAHRSQVWPLLAAKLTSSGFGLAYFLIHSQAFAHLLIPLVDLPIALAIWWAYRRSGLGPAHG